MWAIATDVCTWHGLSVCVLVTSMSPAKVAELIETVWQRQIRVGPENHVLDGDTYWGHLVNMIELCSVIFSLE